METDVSLEGTVDFAAVHICIQTGTVQRLAELANYIIIVNNNTFHRGLHKTSWQ